MYMYCIYIRTVRWLFNQEMLSKKHSFFLNFILFFAPFCKFHRIRRHRILRYFSNLTIHFYDTVFKYSECFDILGMRLIHSIHGSHATDICINVYDYLHQVEDNISDFPLWINNNFDTLGKTKYFSDWICLSKTDIKSLF